jgi:isoamylase
MTLPARARAQSAAAGKQALRDVWSPELGNRRDVDVYLPASYASGRRYRVVYMQDGQNLSDPQTAFAGTWRLDETLRDLATQPIELIVVGVHNTDRRLAEYSPYRDPKRGGGEGDRYLSFLGTTLKPEIDRLFRTRPSAADTAIVGSSMGGLVALYGWLRRPDIFGLAGAMSPSLWYGREALFGFVQDAALPRGPLYIDVGTSEGSGALRDVRALRAALRRKGLAAERFRYKEDRGARHEEAAWARRLGPALSFLFGRRTFSSRSR